MNAPAAHIATASRHNRPMCLIALAWNLHPRWRLLMAGNRDEFHARPSAALQRRGTPARPVLAGRDLRSGGTWMGLAANGRAAVVTNVRDPGAAREGCSRGHLVEDYLAGQDGAAAWAARVAPQADRYPPFNLVLADQGEARFVGNHPFAAGPLGDGIHALSNGAPDAPWPKSLHLAAALRRWIDNGRDDPAPLWAALADRTVAPDADLPDTGIGLDLERQLSPAFICGPAYGTRASTLLAIDHAGHGWIHERRFGADGIFLGQTRLAL